ncbi:Tyrosine recombinase XerD [Fundidesulfovibrio magnetotacticus]|uniref:Tyrosine recombinase XerD n=1 Tax=Fundidesulfovibrio magnetotacticus TaxID=2730080 RepID=A0A6V8LSG7_9BACT|nr:site-specific integrase [Fundidesulfovibrio magnetotacticus]GFK95422.1 Tyrosine recombinase XerD [Fundidesulfovibrio magnetotacticus]
MGRIRTKFLGVYKRESLTRRHNGKPDVCFDISLKDSTGRKIWEKIGWASEGYTAATASEKRARRIQELRDGVRLPTRKHVLTVDQGFKTFKEKALTGDSRWNRTVEAMWEQHILPVFRNRAMGSLTSLDVDTFRNALLASGRSPQTVRHILGSLRHVYRTLAKWGLFDGLIPVMEMPTVDSGRLRYLTPVEAHALLEAIRSRSLKWWRISLLSLHTGMRLGEVLALRAQDVDLGSGVVNVKDAKTGTRAAYLTGTAREELGKALPDAPGALVFPGRKGRQSRDSSDTFNRAVAQCGLNAGITDPRDKVVFHTLRHTFGSWAIQKGVPIERLAKLMGHSTLELTRRYAKLAPDQMRSSVQVIEDTWRGVTHGRAPGDPRESA